MRRRGRARGRETNEPRAEGGEVETRADGETRKDASRQRKRVQRAERGQSGDREAGSGSQASRDSLRRRAVQIPKRNGNSPAETRHARPRTNGREREGAKRNGRRGERDAGRAAEVEHAEVLRRRGLKPQRLRPGGKTQVQPISFAAASVVRQRLPALCDSECHPIDASDDPPCEYLNQRE